MKICILPKIKAMSGGGVVSVITAHREELAKRGVEFTDNEQHADLVVVHAIANTSYRPDVFHSHGFYPTAQAGWGSRYDGANKQLFQNTMTARAVVSVSELAAEVMRRDFHVTPLVIRNGVNIPAIRKAGKSNGYILYPKSDINPTCDPSPFLEMVRIRPDLRLASIAHLGGEVKSFGKMPHSVFMALLTDCAIYFGTTRENCSMATMEAMATGVPVVGYDWGFNRELLKSGDGCELVEPGDIEGLSHAINMVLKNWRSYSGDACDFARNHFGWDEPISRIYDLYTSLLNPRPPKSVSVVIPLHNYAKWVGDAIQSVKNQTVQPIEIIVVDDASSDHPKLPNDVKVITLTKNVGVATARNIGVAKAMGDLIVCLDADDKLERDYLRRAAFRFRNDAVGIVYGSVALTDDNGGIIGKRWFDAPFNWTEQSIGRNRIPTCCMFRKVAWGRAGGYRKYETPAEDAGLWTRIVSQGWKVEFIADRITTMYYRMHPNSLSHDGKFPDWVSGREWKKRNSGLGFPVQIYDCPLVSFIMRYSSKGELGFIRTADSIEGLKAIDWELCVSGVPSPLVKYGFPYVRWDATPAGKTTVFLEAGEIVTEKEWADIVKGAEFPI